MTEPPVEHLRDPLYKTEREIMKVYMLIILSALFSFPPATGILLCLILPKAKGGLGECALQFSTQI